MKKNKKYFAGETLLGVDGLLYVDGSGISWTRYMNKRDIKSRIEEVATVGNFNRVFDKRGFVLSVPPIVSTVMDFKKFYKKEVKILKKITSLHRHTDTPEELNNSIRGEKEYRKMVSTLNAGIKKYGSIRGNIPVKDIKSFLEHTEFNKLFSSKQELIIATVFSGDGNGLLSADIPMMTAYHELVQHFGLKECFIYNSIRASLEEA